MSADKARIANVKRLESILQTLSAKNEEVRSSILFGTWKHHLSDLIRDLLDVIYRDASTFLSVLKTENPIFQNIRPELDRVNDVINFVLDDILHLIDTLLNTNNKHSPVHEYVSYVLRDLTLANKIRYFICVSETLATIPLIKHLEQLFSNIPYFADTKAFLETYDESHREFFILLIPALILQKKEYWPAIVHEIGHMVTEYLAF